MQRKYSVLYPKKYGSLPCNIGCHTMEVYGLKCVLVHAHVFSAGVQWGTTSMTSCFFCWTIQTFQNRVYSKKDLLLGEGILSINALSASHDCSRQHSWIFFHCFSEKIRLDVSCESSARQRIHTKNHALFSSKDKSKQLKCRLLQFLFGALRVKSWLPS